MVKTEEILRGSNVYFGGPLKYQSGPPRSRLVMWVEVGRPMFHAKFGPYKPTVGRAASRQRLTPKKFTRQKIKKFFFDGKSPGEEIE